MLLSLSISTLIGQEFKRKDSLLVILTAGLPLDNLYLDAKNVVAEKWGLEFRSISGCLVSEEILDSLENNNSKVLPLIEDKYGENWRVKFNEEIEIEKKRQILGLNLISESKILEINAKELIEAGHCCMFRLLSRFEDESYHALVMGWHENLYETELIVFYQLSVNIDDEIVELVSDEPIQLKEYYRIRNMESNKQ